MTIQANAQVAAITDSEESRRPRLLLSAFACNPYRGSEPGVGWNRAISAVESCDTWVLCVEESHGPAIRRYLAEHGPIADLHFIPIERNFVASIASRIPGLYYLSYRIWQWQAYQVAIKLHQQVHFDLIHQATFCGYREPGYLWRLSSHASGSGRRPAFVWGPLGGTQNFPMSMLSAVGKIGAAREALRTMLNRLSLRFGFRVRQAIRAADVVLAANTTVKRDLDKAFGCDVGLLLETGVNRTVPTKQKDGENSLRVLWSGVVEPWKAAQLLVRAVALLPDAMSVQVRVVGDGSERRRCQRLAKKLGVDQRIQWLGEMEYNQALQQYAWANVFTFTSMRDTSGNVMLEALDAGLPVIAVDHQGAHDIITDQCGIKVPVESPQQCAQGIADAMRRLAEDPQLRDALSQGALARADQYCWSKQRKRMEEIYQDVLRTRSMRSKCAQS